MPWHDDIIQPKGQGVKKRVTESKSAHCTQPFWSPWRGSGDLGVCIGPEGPLNSAWLSSEGHTDPSQHPMCLPGWSLLCPRATALLGFHLATPSPPSCPPPQPPPTPQLPKRDFYPKSGNEKHLPRSGQAAFCLVLQSSGSRRWGWGLPQGIFRLPYLRIKTYFTSCPHGHALPCARPSTL